MRLSDIDMLMCLNSCQFSCRPVVLKGSKKCKKKTHAKPESIRYKMDEVKLIDLQFYKVDYSKMVQSVGGSEGWSCPSTCWQIRELAVSINSPCVRRGRLGECNIRLGYAPFLTAIAFRKVGSI